MKRLIGENEDDISQDWLFYFSAQTDTALLEAAELQKTKYANLSGGRGITVQQKKDIIQEITGKAIDTQGYEKYIQALKKKSPCLAWNTVYFYLDGKKVEQYSKHSDFQESIFYLQENALVINHNGHSIVTIKGTGLTIGIEICLDHAYDVLKDYISTQHLELPDIHLILSACVVPKVGFGKVLIHSSSHFPFNYPSLSTTKVDILVSKNGETISIPVIRGAIECLFSQYLEAKNAEDSLKNHGNLNFEKFKATVSSLVGKGYQFQLIENSKSQKDALKIKMIPAYQQISAEEKIITELTELIKQLRVAIFEKGIEENSFEVKRENKYEMIIQSNYTNLKIIGALIYNSGCDYIKSVTSKMYFFRSEVAKDDSSPFDLALI